ncbi:MAG: hypothetical protein ABF544_11835, partial [Acetobacter orientalis]|uniref:acyltransferase family protein n=1 Tax=Acetobacter orientalis TaxID=146474 RepID=UPI0039EC807B
LLPIIQNNTYKKHIGTMLILLASVLFYSISFQRVPLIEPYYWTGIMFACLVVGLGLNPVKWIVNNFTSWLGKISYSIYLIHSLVIVLLFPVYKKIQAMNFDHTLTFLLSVLLTISLVLPLSAFVFYTFEQPINNFGRKIANRYSKRSS